MFSSCVLIYIDDLRFEFMRGLNFDSYSVCFLGRSSDNVKPNPNPPVFVIYSFFSSFESLFLRGGFIILREGLTVI